jgi:hypothetical protein
MSKRTSSPDFRRRRAELLEGNPLCHWCKKAPATEADHLIEYDIVGDDTPLVPSCKSCNARRGANYINGKRSAQQHARNEHLGYNPAKTTPQMTKYSPRSCVTCGQLFQPISKWSKADEQKYCTKKCFYDRNKEVFLKKENNETPSPYFLLSEGIQTESVRCLASADISLGVGMVEPRLESVVQAVGSYGDQVAAWAERVQGKTLFEWQRIALNGQLSHDVNGDLVFRESLVATARQNGKSVALTALIGWALTEWAVTRGKAVHVLSVANKLDRAVAIFNELAPVLEAQFDAHVTWSYGRNKVEMPTGSSWEVRAATSNLHGGTYDLIVVDEIWNVSEEVYFDALRPSQIAVKSPLLSSWSTSGDESSKTMQRLREAAIGAIDQQKQTRLYFAEWSLPSGANPNEELNWGYANPALGQTITLEALQAAAETPDRAAFLRAHLNLWVSSADAWIQPGVWDRLFTESECPAGGVLAVDSSSDSSKYVGIRCGLTEEGNIIATVQFSTESLKDMWIHVNKAMDEDPKLRLAISPALDLHTPEKLERRRQIFGYAEVLKFTGLTRSLILEKRIYHRGEELLATHVNRAVLARANGQVVISSQRSPGPIEAARLLVVAAALVSRPSNTGRAAMAFGR